MRYTPSQAKSLARQIKTRFGPRIKEACQGTAIPEAFLAGLISVEAGKDSRGRLDESATRYERHVFAALKALQGGQRRSYNGIRPSQVRDASDAALRALATSYSLTQIMGWHCINNLKCTVGELRDPEKHLRYAVELLKINSRDGDFERRALAGEWREWNSGSETGRTHDPDYVSNAAAVMNAYESVASEPSADATPGAGAAVEPPLPAPQINVERADEVTTAPQPIPGGMKDDPPVQASTGGKKSMWATLSGTTILTALGAVWTWAQGNLSAVTVIIICITWLITLFMFRQFILDFLRMKYMASPDKINVK